MRSETEQTYQERILRVLMHIQNHLDEALLLDELAAVAHFSPYHFHRVFQGMVGETVMAHIRRLRLERAAVRLELSDQLIARIAFDAGFETHEAFTRAFRAMFGESPSRFRELRQSVTPLPVPSGVHYTSDGVLATFTPLQGGPPVDVTIKQLDEQRVAFMRHVGPYHEVGPTWERLCMWAGQKGLMGPNVRMLGICHDNPEITPPDKIRYDACIVVDSSLQAEGEVGVQTVAGGEYAIVVHKGPYENLTQTYMQLYGQWLPSQGREIRSSPCFEVYLNDPQSTPPEELLTEINVPLVAK